MPVNFGTPILSWHDTRQDGTVFWSARWQAFNNNGTSVGYWNVDLQSALANMVVSVDHGSIWHYTTNAAQIELLLVGKHQTAEPIPVLFYTTTAGATVREPFFGPFRPMHMPALGATNNAIMLAVYAGGDAADDYDVSIYGRAWPRRVDADAPEYVQPVSIRDARIWPWKR